MRFESALSDVEARVWWLGLVEISARSVILSLVTLLGWRLRLGWRVRHLDLCRTRGRMCTPESAMGGVEARVWWLGLVEISARSVISGLRPIARQ